MRGNCLNCGYCKEEKDEDGNIRYYCNDRDCTVDPYDPECNYDENEDYDQFNCKSQIYILSI